ncbi:sulfite exporter TauE/SafE family protein [Thermodesulfatator atlanticus]|uniref:sulfite exporter TauE/SafE family protein n=1 Tax=Thermodesulfatator atlanticus TaxID=501497 RepID=UPI0003B3CC01|nr:sulfite exporter TauE/SafE family protein [Thermodesulfatator atlanticus]
MLILIGIILFLAAFIHGVAGFAFALFAVPLLSFCWPLKKVVPLIALLATTLNGIMLFKLRHAFQFKRVFRLLAGGIPGVVLGAYFLAHFPNQFVRVLLGVVLVAYGLWGLKNPRPALVLNESWGYLFGFMAGFLGGALNTPGPPVVVYVTLQHWQKDEIKSTIQGFFFLLAGFVIFSHWRLGILNLEVLKHYVLFLPVVLTGMFLGHRFYFRLSLKAYYRILYLILILVGVLSFPW